MLGKKLSQQQMNVLGYAKAGFGLYTGCRTMGESGARGGTISSLRRMGLIGWNEAKLTDAGMLALETGRAPVTPNVQAQGRAAGLPAKRPAGAVGWASWAATHSKRSVLARWRERYS